MQERLKAKPYGNSALVIQDKYVAEWDIHKQRTIILSNL
jgi:hypothetical protein